MDSSQYKQQDDFFYKISQFEESSGKETFEVRVVSTNKRHLVALDSKSEVGFSGLPFEFERQLKSLNMQFEEIACYPMANLMMVNFLVTEGFAKMQNKKTLYQKMSAICD